MQQPSNSSETKPKAPGMDWVHRNSPIPPGPVWIIPARNVPFGNSSVATSFERPSEADAFSQGGVLAMGGIASAAAASDSSRFVVVGPQTICINGPFVAALPPFWHQTPSHQQSSGATTGHDASHSGTTAPPRNGHTVDEDERSALAKDGNRSSGEATMLQEDGEEEDAGESSLSESGEDDEDSTPDQTKSAGGPIVDTDDPPGAPPASLKTNDDMTLREQVNAARSNPTTTNSRRRSNNKTTPRQEAELAPLDVEGLSHTDIVCARDKKYLRHAGNVFFSKIVHSAAGAYRLSTTKKEKQDIVKSTIAMLQNTHGCRFVKQAKTSKNEDSSATGEVVGATSSSSPWVDVSKSDIREKVGHAIRFATKRQKERTFSSKKKEAP